MDLRRDIHEKSNIHVWRVPLALGRVTMQDSADMCLLSVPERARAHRFLRLEPRLQFIRTRAAARRLLGLYLDREPAQIAIASGEFGKPFLPSPLEAWLQFNISHALGYALVAVRRELSVGVDIEKVHHDFDWESLAYNFFAPDERAALSRRPAADRRRAFFACWTRKEALVKAVGRGLHIPPKSFAVPMEDGFCTASVEATSWSLGEIPVPAGYVAAFAAEGQIVRLQYFDHGSGRGHKAE